LKDRDEDGDIILRWILVRQVEDERLVEPAYDFV